MYKQVEEKYNEKKRKVNKRNQLDWTIHKMGI